jgi:two-component system response regulator NreC
MMSLRILLVHRHSLVLQALKALVEGHGFTVVGQSAREDAARLAETLKPDVTIVDFDLPSANGLDTARNILQSSPSTKVIILSSHTQEFYITEALQLGVSGYVLTTRTADELLRGIEEVAQGRSYFSPEVANVMLQPYFGKHNGRRPDRLTERERQVVTLIAEGNSTKEVAARLGISVKTADCHRTRIMDKLNVHQTANLVRYAIREGLVQP